MMYLVTSLHRSGSSMMMCCLETGGMAAMYGHEQDFLNVLYGRDGYQPNPDGFYGLDNHSEFYRPDFAAEYDGRLLKIPAGQVMNLAAGDYRTIVMRRDPAEILASMAEFALYQVFSLEHAVWFYDLVFPALIGTLEARRMTVDVVDYAAVIADPLGSFEALAKAGWPIDAGKSAACVDTTQRRQVIRHG